MKTDKLPETAEIDYSRPYLERFGIDPTAPNYELLDRIRVIENRLKIYIDLLENSKLFEQCGEYEKFLKRVGKSSEAECNIMTTEEWCSASAKLDKVLGHHRFLKDYPLKAFETLTKEKTT